MTLADAIGRLQDFDDESIIFALEPWSNESETIVARESDDGGVPHEAVEAGMSYFLEIHIARDFVEDWLASLAEPPTAAATSRRVIDYAINDA